MRHPRKKKSDKTHSWLQFDERLHDWNTRVVRHPRFNIILPLLIITVFSYHTLSNLTISLPSSGYLSSVELSDGEVSSIAGAENLNLTMIQVFIRSIDEDHNILSKKSLLEFLAFQNKLLEGLAQSVAVSSLFKIWNHSLDMLYRDESPIQTINAKRLFIPQYSLLGTWKINGFISSATSCVISLLTENEELPRVRQLLQKNMEYLNSISNVTTFHILEPNEVNHDFYGTKAIQSIRLSFIKISENWGIAVFLVYCSLMFHLFMSMRMLRNSVKSVACMTVAIIVQVSMAIASSITVTELLFRQSNDDIPVKLLCWPVILLLMNIQLKSLATTSHSDAKGESFGQRNIEDLTADARAATRVHEAKRGFISRLANSQLKSFKVLLIFSAAVILIMPFNAKACHFLLFAVWLGQSLNCTLFAAIVSLDYRGRDHDILTDKTENDDLILDDATVSKCKRIGYKHVFQIVSSSSFTLMIVVSYLVFCNQTFSLVQSSAPLVFRLLAHIRSCHRFFRNPEPKMTVDRRFIAERAFSLGASNSTTSFVVDLAMGEALMIIQSEDNSAFQDLLNTGMSKELDVMSSNDFYKVDFTYALQFVASVVLVLCCTLLGLQRLTEKQESNKFDLFGSPDIEPVSEVSLAKKTDDSSSSSQDKEVVDRTNPDHFHMKELYRGGHGLDILIIATSKAPFIVSAGLDHKVLVWSPLADPVPVPTKIPLQRKFWPLSKVLLSDDGNYIAFFAKNGNITTWSRKHMKFIWEIKLKNQGSNNALQANLLEALFRRVTIPAFKKNRMKQSVKQREVGGGNVVSSEYMPVMTGGLDTSYENPRRMSDGAEEMNELVFVTSLGLIYSIQDDGVIKVEKLTPSEHSLSSCKLLSSPRVNDRLVACDEMGDIYIATVVNNKWRPNKLKINYDRILKPPSSTCEMKDPSGIIKKMGELEVTSETDNTIELVQFVGLIVRVLGRSADLIDAQTGTVVKTFQIDNFKQNTLRVFHDSPTHCRFCGSASVASFSIAYTDATSNRVIMHTYKLESKTKTSICLRVERDLREIRCLGMESAVETVHYIYDVENWCVTDSNILIGINKVPEVLEPTTAGSSSMTRSLANEDDIGLLQRKKSTQKSNDIHSPCHLIHNIWQGWTMSANGKILFHKIPVGVTGLVTDKLGPLSKFGAKAVVVGFANIMDLFYMGHENLIFSTERNDGNKEETGLRFVHNRRDRFSHKKLPLNYSNL